MKTQKPQSITKTLIIICLAFTCSEAAKAQDHSSGGGLGKLLGNNNRPEEPADPQIGSKGPAPNAQPPCDLRSSSAKVFANGRQGSAGLVVDEHGLHGEPGALYIATARHVFNESGQYERNKNSHPEEPRSISLQSAAGSFSLSTAGAIGIGKGEMVLIPTTRTFGMRPVPLAIGRSPGETYHAGYTGGRFGVAQSKGTLSFHKELGSKAKRIQQGPYGGGISGGLSVNKKCQAVGVNSTISNNGSIAGISPI